MRRLGLFWAGIAVSCLTAASAFGQGSLRDLGNLDGTSWYGASVSGSETPYISVDSANPVGCGFRMHISFHNNGEWMNLSTPSVENCARQMMSLWVNNDLEYFAGGAQPPAAGSVPAGQLRVLNEGRTFRLVWDLPELFGPEFSRARWNFRFNDMNSPTRGRVVFESRRNSNPGWSETAVISLLLEGPESTGAPQPRMCFPRDGGAIPPRCFESFPRGGGTSPAAGTVTCHLSPTLCGNDPLDYRSVDVARSLVSDEHGERRLISSSTARPSGTGR